MRTQFSSLYTLVGIYSCTRIPPFFFLRKYLPFYSNSGDQVLLEWNHVPSGEELQLQNYTEMITRCQSIEPVRNFGKACGSNCHKAGEIVPDSIGEGIGGFNDEDVIAFQHLAGQIETIGC